MTKFDDLKAEHQRLLAAHDAGGEAAGLLAAVQQFIEGARVASEQVSDPRDRDQLRAYLRFWGAFLYDQSGTYPDTTLRPAAPVASQPQSRRLKPWMWALLALIAVIAVIVMGVSLVFRPRMATSINLTATLQEAGTLVTSKPAPSEPPNPTLTPSMADISSFPTQTVSAPSNSTATSTPVLPMPTNTPPASETPIALHTATLAALPTQASQVTATPGEEVVVLLPETGGGGWLTRPMLVAEVNGGDAGDWCTSRYLNVSVTNPELVFRPNASLALTIDPAGDQRAFSQEISMKEPTVTLDLVAYQAFGAYALLHLEHPQTTSTDVIFQYSPDCRSDQLQVVYQMAENTTSIEAEPPRNPDLALVWHFVTWGPAPVSGNYGSARWFALLELSAQGGDGTYF
ncbi:MAG TPA: hypothetical protein DEH25_14015, partial [Chloroflexi bacterium]|nr:hypothetical protein [Chloroflexota bacterium]